VKVALDSNIIIYAEGLVDDTRNALAQRIVAVVPPDKLVIPLQAVSETLFWLIRRAGLPPAAACQSIGYWLRSYSTQAVDDNVMQGATELIAAHRLQVFDAIILSCASSADASVLLSEDMQDGFSWRGVTVVNPFLPTPNPLIRNLIAA
jgi:predicted nucleic acid-binding protein